MNSPVDRANRQIPAQTKGAVFLCACNAGDPCQSLNQAESKSPFSAMVCRNHYPSPSSARFVAQASGPGLFLSDLAVCRLQAKRFCFRNPVFRGRLVGNKNTTRGKHRCRSAKPSRGLSPFACWQDASGMTFNAPVSARRQAQWSRKRPAATFLPVQSSARAQVRCAMTLASNSVTDATAALGGLQITFQPAGRVPGGFFIEIVQGAPVRHAQMNRKDRTCSRRS